MRFINRVYSINTAFVAGDGDPQNLKSGEYVHDLLVRMPVC